MSDHGPGPGPTVAALRQARIAAGLTQRQLADRLGCQQSSLSEWESGHCRLLAATVDAWAEALGLRIELVPREPS